MIHLVGPLLLVHSTIVLNLCVPLSNKQTYHPTRANDRCLTRLIAASHPNLGDILEVRFDFVCCAKGAFGGLLSCAPREQCQLRVSVVVRTFLFQMLFVLELPLCQLLSRSFRKKCCGRSCSHTGV